MNYDNAIKNMYSPPSDCFFDNCTKEELEKCIEWERHELCKKQFEIKAGIRNKRGNIAYIYLIHEIGGLCVVNREFSETYPRKMTFGLCISYLTILKEENLNIAYDYLKLLISKSKIQMFNYDIVGRLNEDREDYYNFYNMHGENIHKEKYVKTYLALSDLILKAELFEDNLY